MLIRPASKLGVAWCLAKDWFYVRGAVSSHTHATDQYHITAHPQKAELDIYTYVYVCIGMYMGTYISVAIRIYIIMGAHTRLLIAIDLRVYIIPSFTKVRRCALISNGKPNITVLFVHPAVINHSSVADLFLVDYFYARLLT